MLLHVKEIEAPMSLTAANVAHIKVKLHFICASAKLHGGPVMALVHILVDVLNSLDRGNRLNVNMAAILPDEIFRVADNPLIVNLLSSDLISQVSIRAPGACIRVFCDGGLCSKRLRKALGTPAIHHARCIRILSFARPMNHKFLNKVQAAHYCPVEIQRT
jgi:hypothetical protein